MDLPIDSKTSDFQIYSKGDILLKRLLNYYTSEKKAIICDITQGRTNLSLRIIDWFVTNYSKNNCIPTQIPKMGLELITSNMT